MFSVSDILKILDNIPVWKTLTKLPKRIEELENRIIELEKIQKSASGAEICPKCKKTSFELLSTKPHPLFWEVGTKERHYKCSSCGFEELQTVD